MTSSFTRARGLAAEERALPEGICALDMADLCRAAVLDFLDLDEADRSALVGWLWASYAPVLATAGADDVGNHVEAMVEALPRNVFGLVFEARRYLLDRLRGCREWRGESPADDDLALVARAFDSLGGAGYVPVTDPSMSLAERCLSLVIADFVTRPRDYVEHLVVEENSAAFAWPAAGGGSSDVHPKKHDPFGETRRPKIA